LYLSVSTVSHFAVFVLLLLLAAFVTNEDIYNEFTPKIDGI